MPAASLAVAAAQLLVQSETFFILTDFQKFSMVSLKALFQFIFVPEPEFALVHISISIYF